MSSGARFVRADLHVHTRPDSGAPIHTPADYVGAALAAGIAVMGITDHNAVDAVEPMLRAAQGTGLLVLPGIEISTHEGHLLALFAPEAVQTLVELAGPSALRLQPDPRDGSLRSTRSMLDLVAEIDDRGGLAIPAHIDAKDGIHEAMAPTAWPACSRIAGSQAWSSRVARPYRIGSPTLTRSRLAVLPGRRASPFPSWLRWVWRV
jgi:PHP domain